MFPFSKIGLDEIKNGFYESLIKSGLEKEMVSAIKYVNEKAGRLCIPTKNKPIAISIKELNEWLGLYCDGLRMKF